MEDKKGRVKRCIGKIETNIKDPGITDAAYSGLKEKGLEIVAHELLDDQGEYAGEVAEIYWVD